MKQRTRTPRQPAASGRDIILIARGEYVGYYDGQPVAFGSSYSETEAELDAYVYEQLARAA